MRLESNGPVDGEPEDGWIEAPMLVDTELLQLVLCRFTGNHTGLLGCITRAQRLHPDVDCQAVYFQAQALLDGRVSSDGFDDAPEQVRVPWTGGDVIATSHEVGR